MLGAGGFKLTITLIASIDSKALRKAHLLTFKTIVKMSDQQVIQHLNRIINMMLQQTLPNKEILNSREAGLYMGLSPDYVCWLARMGKFPSFRPNNGKRFYRKRDLRDWMLSTDRTIGGPTSEAEKLAVLNPEMG
jgi:hypothetical protein